MLRKLLLAVVLVVAGMPIEGPSIAAAATTSVAVANVNLRAGPSTEYPVVTVVPAGAQVATYGCVSGYTWCDVGFGSYRGWVAASYIEVTYQGAPVVVTAAVAPAVGLVVVPYTRAYWDTYYRAYPWYGSWAAYPVRTVWAAPPPPRVTSAGRAVGCAGGTCAGVRGATGAYGGATVQTRSCSDGSCSATRNSEGPRGGTATRTRECGWGDGCSSSRTGTGPRGGSFSGGRTFQR